MTSHADAIRRANAHARAWLVAPEVAAEDAIEAANDLSADVLALLAENQRLRERCPLCNHKWRYHDPEDGQCDSHSSEGLDVCECGRDLEWMQSKIASLSRAALEARR